MTHDYNLSKRPLSLVTLPTGVTQKKTVYIESPLLDNEITVRQKSLIYHEESLKLSFTKKGKRNVCHLMTELPVDDREPSLVSGTHTVHVL